MICNHIKKERQTFIGPLILKIIHLRQMKIYTDPRFTTSSSRFTTSLAKYMLIISVVFVGVPEGKQHIFRISARKVFTKNDVTRWVLGDGRTIFGANSYNVVEDNAHTKYGFIFLMLIKFLHYYLNKIWSKAITRIQCAKTRSDQ